MSEKAKIERLKLIVIISSVCVAIVMFVGGSLSSVRGDEQSAGNES
jgi:hypothetical protein